MAMCMCQKVGHANTGMDYAIWSQYSWKIAKETGFAVTIEAVSKVSEQFGIAASEDNHMIVVMMIERN